MENRFEIQERLASLSNRNETVALLIGRLRAIFVISCTRLCLYEIHPDRAAYESGPSFPIFLRLFHALYFYSWRKKRRNMIGRIFSRIFISHDISSIEFNDPRIFFLGPMFDFSKDAWREKGSACRFQSPELEPEPGSRFLGWSGSGVCLATGLRIEVRAGSRPDRPRSTCEPPTNRTDDLQASGAHAPLGDSGNGTAAVPFPSPLAPYPNPVYRPWPVFRWLASLEERACYFLDLRGHSLFFPFPPPPPKKRSVSTG